MTTAHVAGLRPAPRPLGADVPVTDALWWQSEVAAFAATSVVGRTVAGTDDRLGKVSAVVHVAGRARLEVRPPGAALGKAPTIVPAGLVTVVDGVAGLVLVNMSVAQLRGAPAPGERGWDDPRWQREVVSYWRAHLCRH